MSFETEIFDDKTLAGIFKDVYKNSEIKRKRVDEFLKKLVPYINNPEDAAVIAPIIINFMELQTKSDEHLVKLAQIAQRLVAVNAKSDTGAMLTDSEKEQLLQNVKLDFEDVIAEQQELEDALDSLEGK